MFLLGWCYEWLRFYNFVSSDVALTFILLWMLACDYFLSYRTQGSKFPLQKSHLLATFSCKMITIEKIWLPNKKSHWRTLHAALLAVIWLLIQPNIDGLFKFFFFQICWQLSPKFQWPNLFFTCHGNQNNRNLEHCCKYLDQPWTKPMGINLSLWFIYNQSFTTINWSWDE